MYMTDVERVHLVYLCPLVDKEGWRPRGGWNSGRRLTCALILNRQINQVGYNSVLAVSGEMQRYGNAIIYYPLRHMLT